MQSTEPEKHTPEKLDVKSLHFGWFVGHFSVVACSTLFFLSQLIFYPLVFFYRLAYLSVIASYGIVLYNSYRPFTSSEPYFKRMLLDENTQYMIIAVYFLFSRRIAVTLLPFFIYSVFHVLEFTYKQVIPSFAPQQKDIQSKLKSLVDKYHDLAMVYTAKIEVCGVMTRLVLGLFVFRSSLLSVLLYTHFLRMRYYMSSDMRQFLNETGTKIDQLLTPPTAHPKIPPAVIKAYATAKEKYYAKAVPATTATAPQKKKL